MNGENATVIFDSWVEDFRQNRVFDESAVRQMPGSMQSMALPWLEVARRLRPAGFECLTSDVIEANGIDPRGALLVAHDWTPRGARLLQRGAMGIVTTTFEPPVIAWHYYLRLRSISARFAHAFVFPGALDRVSASTVAHPLRFPQVEPPERPTGIPLASRRYLVMINSGKALVRSPLRWFDRPREFSIRREIAALQYRPIHRDRYPERLRAIRAFASSGDFDLYGEGWERRHSSIGPRTYAIARSVYRGTVGDKHAALAGYRFALCIENTHFPGYISEKVFDCFFAGCVPVYDGAPDVERYLPPETFVDRRQFGDYRELDRYLRALSEREVGEKLEAAQAFLRSPAFDEFRVERFANAIADVVFEAAGMQRGKRAARAEDAR